MSEPTITVWGAGTPRTLRVYWALHELNLAYRRESIRTRTADMERADFLAVSPGKKIPCFVDGELVLTESGAIVSYLFDRYGPQNGSAETRAKDARWSFFVLTEIDATALYVMRRHQDLPEVYGEAPAAVSAAIQYFDRQIGVLDAALADGREFINGNVLGPADIFVVTCCDWALVYKLSLPAAVRAYQTRHHMRRAYRDAGVANQPAT